jgi:hypothetical protein
MQIRRFGTFWYQQMVKTSANFITVEVKYVNTRRETTVEMDSGRKLSGG